MGDRFPLRNKLPRPHGSVGKHTFNTPITLSSSYVTRHQGYNVFANNDNSILDSEEGDKDIGNLEDSVNETVEVEPTVEDVKDNEKKFSFIDLIRQILKVFD